MEKTHKPFFLEGRFLKQRWKMYSSNPKVISWVWHWFSCFGIQVSFLLITD